MSHLGEFAALLTAMFWTVTALAFEAASRRIGSMAVNLLRLVIGFAFLNLLPGCTAGTPPVRRLPTCMALPHPCRG